MQSEFEERVRAIAPHGLGLSVDVYSPDLVELDATLRRRGLESDYYEIFQASVPALELVRDRLSGRRLAYHGEGLWVTQPDFVSEGGSVSSVPDVCAQLRTLHSGWLNIECATKQMAGRSFGTYLPPLYTESGALIAAENAVLLQRRLDHEFSTRNLQAPLLLLEMPPLTYFSCGALPIPDFFSEIASRTACGLVLDIGHLWTVYRYTGAWRYASVERYVGEFLAGFPLERVVEIHVAGLALHPCDAAGGGPEEPAGMLPRWIDAHGAPIPALLFDLLEQILRTGRLVHLKGMALEVDTKEISLLVSEYQDFRRRFESIAAGLFSGRPPSGAVTDPADSGSNEGCRLSTSRERRAALGQDYAHYADMVTGRETADSRASMVESGDQQEGVAYYRQVYLPYEILHWGGELRDMFPRTCEILQSHVDMKDFVAFWFRRPRPARIPYDFFLLKVEYFVDFVATVMPDALAMASEEAEELRAAYDAANRRAGFEEMTT
ncbi:MAG: DUF692 family protein [Nitrospira sp.]